VGGRVTKRTAPPPAIPAAVSAVPRGTAPRAVLVTRPAPGDAETVAALRALGWDPLPAPALVLRELPPARLPRAQALLLASRAAARALPPLPLPVLAVGAGTAAEARARGFADVIAAEGDAAALATLAAARLHPEAGPLLLAVGRGYGAELAAALRARGFSVIRRVVYAAQPAESLPAPALDALAAGRVAAVLVTSPRGARIFSALLRRAGLAGATKGMRALVLSPRIAAALAPLDFAAVEMPARPDPGLLPALLGAAPG
jgi:uroporphyrinogen-III synthase